MACSLSADRDIICRTKTISSLTIREVFNLERHEITTIRWLVPVFQRRYCWGNDQVRTLLSDAIKLCSLPSPSHSLGRIVVHCQPSGNILVVDGQQRLTTTSILLSAIRDFLLKILKLHPQSSAHQSLLILVELCHDTIYSVKHQHTILDPSYYDRSSYTQCVQYEARDEEEFQKILDISTSQLPSPPDSDTTTTNAPPVVNHILQNRAYFDTVLANGSLCDSIAAKQKGLSTDTDDSLGLNCSTEKLDQLVAVCRTLITTVLDSFTLLYFETQEQDICSVYERLAMREAALAKGFSNSSPGVTLAEADLARNLITSFGCNDASQINLYQQYWAPIEQRAMCADEQLTSALPPTNSAAIFPTNKCQLARVPFTHTSSTRAAKHAPPTSGMTGHLNACLLAFMNSRNEDKSHKKQEPSDLRISHSQPPLQDNTTSQTNNSKNSSTRMSKNTKSLDPASQWMDPGEALFPMYSGLKTCLREALRSSGLPVAMHAPTPEAEAVVSQLLTELLQFATDEYNWITGWGD